MVAKKDLQPMDDITCIRIIDIIVKAKMVK